MFLALGATAGCGGCDSSKTAQQTDEQSEEDKKKEEESSFFGRIKNFFSGDKEEEQKESEVLDFKKNTSIQFALATGTWMILASTPL